jgi:hypothetical protein
MGKIKKPTGGRAASLANLVMWPKGKSGNPGGRSRKRPITELYAQLCDVKLPEDIRLQLKLAPGATWGHAGVLGTYRAMIKGQHGAAKEIREAIEGKATARVEIVGANNGPIKVSMAETIERIREAYGLGPDRPRVESPASSDAVPEGVDRGHKPTEDS